MKAYPEYKASGIDWLGDIPSHWESMQLKHSVLNIDTDFIDGDWIESKDISDSGIRYLTSGNIGAINYKEQGYGFITEDTFARLCCKEVFPGDLLISRLNEPIARTCIIPNLGYRIVTCVDNVIYRPSDIDFCKRFMMYQLNCYPFWSHASGLASGSTMKRISRSKLGRIKIVVPSVAEQEAIAAYLDETVGKIDALISEKRKQMEDIRAYRTSLITETVTRGLNPDAPLRPSGIDWLGEIPSHWKIVKLGWLANVQTGTTPSTSIEEYWNEPTKNWFTPGDFVQLEIKDSKRKVSEFAFNDNACRVFPPYTVYMVGIGSLGKVAYCKESASANQQINAILFNSEIYPVFGAYYLLSIADIIKSKANFATLPILNQEQTKQLLLEVPPLDEQQAIADFLDAKTAKIDELISELTKQIDELTEYKQAVITEAVTGKVDVRDYKPSN